MPHSITLTADERAALLDHLRHAPQPELLSRAHIILLLADGHSWSTLVAVLYCSTRTIARWQRRFARDRVAGLLDQPRGAPVRLARRWAEVVVRWVTTQTPRAFG